MNKPQIIILAAGKGSRMKSDLPKAMHKIAGQTMLDMVIDHAKRITNDITIVYSDALKPYLHAAQDPHVALRHEDDVVKYNNCKLVRQPEQLGTGNAVYCALDSIDESKPTIVLYADNPFINDKMMQDMLRSFEDQKSDMMVLAFERENPKGYGRLVLDDKKYLQKIIECKDADDKEKKITLCNSGIIIFNSMILKELLKTLCESEIRRHPRLDPGSHEVPERVLDGGKKQEYYLTTLVEIGYERGYKTSYFASSDNFSLGVNTQEELERAKSLFALQKK